MRRTVSLLFLVLYAIVVSAQTAGELRAHYGDLM